jgi:hypothetical protein
MMRPQNRRTLALVTSIGAAATLAAGCGSSSSSITTPSGRSGPVKIAELTAKGAAALNANALFRTGLTMAYQAGSTGCAIRALPTGVNTYEFDEWYPNGGDRGGGKATSFTVLDGVASPQPGVNKSDAWRPPDGENCTIHPNGTISVP